MTVPSRHLPGEPSCSLNPTRTPYNHLLSACCVPGHGDPGMSEQGTLPSRNQPFPLTGVLIHLQRSGQEDSSPRRATARGGAGGRR